MEEITFVITDDREGLYINDALVQEGTSVDLPTILDGREFRFIYRSYEDSDNEYLIEHMNMPENLNELLHRGAK